MACLLDNTAGSCGNACDLHEESLKFSSDKGAIYKQWASSYDGDVANQEYHGPQVVANKAAELLFATGHQQCKVLDAGCGTGLAGVALSALLSKNGVSAAIDGCDISPDMLAVAEETGSYSKLWPADLNRPLEDIDSDLYDAILIVGTFTHGHVRPDPALPELVRMLRPGGTLLATIRNDFYKDQDFESTIQKLKLSDHRVEHIEFQYLRGVVAKLVMVTKSGSGLDNTAGSCGNACDLHEESLKFSSDKEAIYKQWASSYDDDVASQNYQGPQVVASKAAELLLATGQQQCKVLDAGCGTGLAGVALSALLSNNSVTTVIDGCDISPDMLAVAEETGSYDKLWPADLNCPLRNVESDLYDAILIVGTFTHGHVRPDPALPELVRVLRPGGTLLATIRNDFYKDQDFESTIQQLELSDHHVEHIKFQYLTGVVAKLVMVTKSGSGLNNTAGSDGNACDLHEESLKFSSDKEAIYKQWASSYDDDVAGQDYQGPQVVASKTAELLLATGQQQCKVLDAGCGTGLAGVALNVLLSKNGVATTIDGCDISPDMLAVAKETGSYDKLWPVDLNRPLEDIESNLYDAILIVGTFTHGHVRPDPALPELVRVLRPGGTLLATIRNDFYKDQDFESTIQQLKLSDHRVEHIDFQYLKGVVAKLVMVTKGSLTRAACAGA